MNEQGGPMQKLLIPGMILFMGGVGYGLWRAQSSGQATFEENAAPYLDALVAGDWETAASLDHSSRTFSAGSLAEAWDDRQARWGDLTGWSLVVANPGKDPNGFFIHGTTQLVFAGRDSPVPVRVELREEADGRLKVARAVPTTQALLAESVW